MAEMQPGRARPPETRTDAAALVGGVEGAGGAAEASSGAAERDAGGGGAPPPATRPVPRVGRERWFHEHYVEAASEILAFLAEDGISLEGADLADVGSGDGIIDLGVAHTAAPGSLVGFDTDATDPATLLGIVRELGVADELPSNLRFEQCSPRTLPAADAAFDVVFSWSTFEHVQWPVALCGEIRRVLRPGGVAMIQLWPFYHSEHGSHLWEWLPEGFDQYLVPRDEARRRVLSAAPDLDWARYQLGTFLNRITLDDLQRALLAGGLRPTKVQLLSEGFHVPPGLAHLPLSLLAISGVKLLAVPLA